MEHARLSGLPACLLLVAGVASAQTALTALAPTGQPEPVDSPAAASVSLTPVHVLSGVPLHLRVMHTAPLHTGAAVDAILESPVYVRDRIALSNGTVLHGVVTGTEPAPRMDRAKAWLNGDVTPQRTPIVAFRSMDGDTGPQPMAAEARVRSTQWVRFVAAKKHQSLLDKGKAMICDQVESTRAQIFEGGKRDRILQYVYSQLPYHPQRIWAGTQMIAELQTESTVSVPEQTRVPLVPSEGSDLDGLHVIARLTTDVDSNHAKKDDAVTATVTEPVYDNKGGLVLPEGSTMRGRVLQSKPSRSFGRNGQLHFIFASVQREGEQPQRANGFLTAAAGAKSENLKVDQEGGVKAEADKGRFLAPIVLGALAVAGQTRDNEEGVAGGGGVGGRQFVGANGLGLVARGLALGINNVNVAAGFGYFATAKSIVFRFLVPGHPVSFAKDTMVEVQLQAR